MSDLEFKITVKFRIGEVVYYSNPSSSPAGRIVAYVIGPKGTVTYRVAWDDMVERECYDFELSETKVLV